MFNKKLLSYQEKIKHWARKNVIINVIIIDCPVYSVKPTNTILFPVMHSQPVTES